MWNCPFIFWDIHHCSLRLRNCTIRCKSVPSSISSFVDRHFQACIYPDTASTCVKPRPCTMVGYNQHQGYRQLPYTEHCAYSDDELFQEYHSTALSSASFRTANDKEHQIEALNRVAREMLKLSLLPNSLPGRKKRKVPRKP